MNWLTVIRHWRAILIADAGKELERALICNEMDTKDAHIIRALDLMETATSGFSLVTFDLWRDLASRPKACAAAGAVAKPTAATSTISKDNHAR